MSTQVIIQNGPSSWIDQQAPGVRDAGGYRIFSEGEVGEAHAFAHRMFDGGRIQAGRRGLEGWLAGRRGQGSEWLHLHFHLALFELETGDWRRAYDRFVGEILPAAASGSAALTDAPGLLWRLAITAPAPVALPWAPLHRTAVANLHRTSKPFVQLHNLLALAGAGDVAGLRQWGETVSAATATNGGRQLLPWLPALKALAARSWGPAGEFLQQVTAEISSIGGSRAQNRLFEQLADWCARRACTAAATAEQRHAA